MFVIRQRKEEKRESKREQEKERRRKTVNLAYLAEHGISLILSTELFRILGLHFETRNFVLRYCNNGNSFV